MPFTDYALLIDWLINTPKDAELLRRKGIVQNLVGDDKTVCDMVNSFTRELAFIQNFSYHPVLYKLNEHCEKRRHLWMATLRRNYFNSPWALVSFVAAVVLLGLTIVQTVFSVLSYARKD